MGWQSQVVGAGGSCTSFILGPFCARRTDSGGGKREALAESSRMRVGTDLQGRRGGEFVCLLQLLLQLLLLLRLYHEVGHNVGHAHELLRWVALPGQQRLVVEQSLQVCARRVGKGGIIVVDKCLANVCAQPQRRQCRMVRA